MTSFNDIFSQFFIIIDDTRFLTTLTEDMLAETLSKYLDRSRGIFGDYCYKNLNNYTATTRNYYQFVGNGVTSQFSLNPAPTIGSDFYVSIDNVVTNNYTYDSNTNKIIFSSTPSLNSDIYIGAYKVGSFNDDLNIQEITILATCMCIPFLEAYLQKRLHLNQIVYGKDYIVHSQAAHIKEIRETIKYRKEEVDQKIMMYTYKQSPDSLSGSSGASLY